MANLSKPGKSNYYLYKFMNKKDIKSRKPLIAALDDDPVVRKYIALALENEGEILFASAVSELKSMIAGVKPDIFLLDINLPDGNGIDLCRELKKDPFYADSFFIILTSQSDQDRIEEAYSGGADEFIRKPFINFELLSKIRIMNHIIGVREHLRKAYQSQLDQNVQLFRLSDFIKKALSYRDSDSVLRNSEVLSEIISVDFIEIVKVRNGVPLSIIQKESSRTEYVPFKEITKNSTMPADGEGDIRYFRFRKGDSEVFNVLFDVRCRNSVFGYVLLQRKEPFSENDREVISLFRDYMSLLNDSLAMQNELRDKNDQYRKEVELIRKLEVSRLPDFKSVKDYSVGYSFMPAQDLSGDFFDGFYLDDDIYQIVLCDVSGHGIASSYVGTQVRTLIREKSAPGKKPSDIVKEVNRELYSALRDMRFYCTAQIVQLYFDTSTILFVSAGHPEAALWRKKKGEMSAMYSRSPVIGMFSDEEYNDEILSLESGDFLFLYTDGITEEHDAEMQSMFGFDRLKESLIIAADLDSTEIIHHCLGDFYEFNGYRPQNDDITLLCIKKN